MAQVELPSGCVITGEELTVYPLFPYPLDTSSDATAYNSRNAEKSKTYYRFRGIPYATQPTGSNRWKPAVLLEEPDPVSFSATSWGNVPYMEAEDEEGGGVGRHEWGVAKGAYNWDEYPTSEGEDCLNLNIWTPPNLTGSFPVIVFLHDGGWTKNCSFFYRMHGHRLAATKGVVFVTVDYRLSTFGFFYHDTFSEESGYKANLALSDILVALQWVQTNISVFGGDKDNVTIMGGSAGGVIVQCMLESSESTGLFHKAWCISGGGIGMRMPMKGHDDYHPFPREGYRRRGKRLWQAMPKDTADYGGVYDTVRDRYDALGVANTLRLGLSPFHILGFSDGLYRFTGLGNASTATVYVGSENVYPFKDGTIINRNNAIVAAKAGDWKNVPVVIGYASNEASLRGVTAIGDAFGVADASYWAMVDYTGDTDTAYEAAYPDLDPDVTLELYECRRRLYRDIIYAYPSRRLAKEHTDNGQTAYWYCWDYVSQGNASTDLAGHTGDQSYWLGNIEWTVSNSSIEDEYGEVYARVFAQDLKLADAMMQALANFAKNGNPNTAYNYTGDWSLFATPMTCPMTAYNATNKNATLISQVGGVGSDGAPVITDEDGYSDTALDYMDSTISY